MQAKERILLECNAMLKYALGKGLNVPNSIVQSIVDFQSDNSKSDTNIQKNDVTDMQHLLLLNKAHSQLSKIVSPAKPNTLVLFEKEEKSSFFRFLGPVGLVQRMLIIAIFSLIALICLSISPYVTGEPKSFGLTTNHGISLLINQLFLISAASIGASFAALFQVNSFIKNATFEPMYESTYWVRFVLGLLAGMMLATLIPLETFDNTNGQIDGFERPLLSLIGGFSASVVFRILTRLATAVETVFKGDIKEIIESKELLNNMKIEQLNIQNKIQLLNELKTLQDMVTQGSDSKALIEELNQIQNSLLGNSEK